jgi:hypothetical protein
LCKPIGVFTEVSLCNNKQKMYYNKLRGQRNEIYLRTQKQISDTMQV